MSFDARSLERLRQLGRSLPQRLPVPEPPAPPAGSSAPTQGSGARLHRLETETDPEALFHELMRASADGSAPPHLLERLRELETRRRLPDPAPPAVAGPDPDPLASTAPSNKQDRRHRERGRPDPKLAREHGDLYTAFQQLLLEDDEI
ncbi:hypothetical protein KBY96_04070 [Cyanobium sp. ATX 6A2]|uniref:hypothetical protein n=1 Tax=Cyanobium sp. ATX 6A2 TaxID=2823700 RepID=UPI0020CD99ED|nr:hypothetical protein [Cyanobium sp. ATX 6A2]MCP9887109.1 hypothetical protein [Cyanobium sp. ATX 6A2]